MSKDENNSITISFLFGAGAEGKGNFDLPTGEQYIRQTLLDNQENAFLTELEKIFNQEYYGVQRYRSKDVLDVKHKIIKNYLMLQAIHNPETLNTNIEKIKIYLTQTDLNEVKKELVSRRPDSKEKTAKLIKECKNKRKEYFQTHTSDKDLRIESDAYLDEILSEEKTKDIVIEGTATVLEDYFYSLANPAKYGFTKFNKIFNYYWTCYFAIVKAIISCFRRKDSSLLNEYVENDGELRYETIIKNMRTFTRELYEKEKNEEMFEGAYYQLLKEKCNEKSIKIEGIATTNYYNFCEILSSKVCYLNGSLNLFEFPETLSVEDFNDENTGKEIDTENELFFPFIFGQSLTKPIVHHKQIEAFNNFKSQLDKCNILVILGYGINEDDNHINAYLREYLISGKSIIYVSKGDKDEREVKEEVRQKLRIKDSDTDKYNIIYVKADEEKNNEKTVNSIIDEIKKIEREKEDAK